MSKKEVLIAELSYALEAFQRAEDITNQDMIEILEECAQMWKRKELFKKIQRKKDKQ